VQKLYDPYVGLSVSDKTRTALSRAHLPPTTVFRRLTTTRHCCGGRRIIMLNTCRPYVGFYRRNKIPRVAVHTISEKVIRFRHPDYDPDRAQKLISSSTSRHLSTRNISSKSIHACLSNLANKQTDRQTDERRCRR